MDQDKRPFHSARKQFLIINIQLYFCPENGGSRFLKSNNNFYHSTWYHTEDINHHIHSCDNLTPDNEVLFHASNFSNAFFLG
jgi:hypothetical protein